MRPVEYAIKLPYSRSINSIVTFTIRFPNKFKVVSEYIQSREARCRNCEFEYPVLKLLVYLIGVDVSGSVNFVFQA